MAGFSVVASSFHRCKTLCAFPIVHWGKQTGQHAGCWPAAYDLGTRRHKLRYATLGQNVPKSAHFVAPPLPTKSCDFAGYPKSQGVFERWERRIRSCWPVIRQLIFNAALPHSGQRRSMMEHQLPCCGEVKTTSHIPRTKIGQMEPRSQNSFQIFFHSSHAALHRAPDNAFVHILLPGNLAVTSMFIILPQYLLLKTIPLIRTN